MATSYTSTVEVNVWKEHNCVACGTVYRYLFKRTKTGQGASPDAARANVHRQVVKALEKEVDLQPCPGCGLYQPDMIAARRFRRHWIVFFSALPFFALFVILGLTDVLAFSTVSWLLGLTALGLALASLIIDAVNPNANLDANHQLAQECEKAGDLWVPKDVKGEPPTGEAVGNGLGTVHLLAYLMLVAAVLALLAPVGLRLMSGWHGNPEWVPEVIGPGDSGYIYLPHKISSVKGMWNGTAQVRVANAQEVGLAGNAVLPATTNNQSWGSSMSVKSSEKNSSSRLWVRVSLPPDANLADKNLALEIDIAVRYPKSDGGTRFNDASNSFKHTTRLKVSRAGAGRTYKTAWWLCLLLGLGLCTTAGVVLPLASSAFARKAHPTRIYVPDGAGLPDEDEEEDRPRRARDEDREGRYRRDEEDDRRRPRYDEDDRDERRPRRDDRYRD